MVVKLPDRWGEVGVVVDSWNPNIGWCPNCRRELRISVMPCCGTPPITPLPPGCFSRICNPTSPVIIKSRHDMFHHDPVGVQRLRGTLEVLKLSGWYYKLLDRQAAGALLKDASPGAFLIRDSGDKDFIFSLSVQTEKGPTSVRLHYQNSYFRLDCDGSLAKYMPRFQCVVELVQHYACTNEHTTVWVDRKGCPHSPVLLKTPLRKNPPSLLHASRLAIHKAIDSNPFSLKLRSAPTYRLLPLPPRLLDYLGEYPYSI